ncbi:MAG: hypothetical protein ACR2OI_05045 [Acidimicrobiia bacterium]
MEEFEGTVRLAGDTGTLYAVMLVADDRLKVSTRRHEIGNWALTEISSSLRDDGCHITAEGEELVVLVEEPKRFAEAIGPRITNPGDGSLLRGANSEDDQNPGTAARIGATVGAVPARWQIIGASTAVVAGLALLAPQLLIGLFLLGALGALLVAGYAYMDPFTAVRLPDPLTPSLLLRTGLAGLVIALALAILL